MIKYSIEDITKEFQEATKTPVVMYTPTNSEIFLFTKIVELTNRIQELESKGKIESSCIDICTCGNNCI